MSGGRTHSGEPRRTESPDAADLISFDDGSMEHIPDEDWPEVGEQSHAVVQEAEDAGVWIFGAGVERQQARIARGCRCAQEVREFMYDPASSWASAARLRGKGLPAEGRLDSRRFPPNFRR
jgi:hypothetical protein